MPLIGDTKLLEFVKECWENQCSFEVMFFLGKHPSAQFNYGAIIRACHQELESEAVFNNLIQRGIIETRSTNSTALYTLTLKEPQRSLVLKLADLNRLQLKLALKQIKQKEEKVNHLAPAVSGVAGT